MRTKDSSSLTEEPKLPRNRAPGRFDDGASSHRYQVPKTDIITYILKPWILFVGEVER